MIPYASWSAASAYIRSRKAEIFQSSSLTVKGSLVRSSRRAATVWFAGVTCTASLWLFLTLAIFPSSGQRLLIALFFAIPIVGYASLWQNRLRNEYLLGDLPKVWSRASLFRVLGEKTTYGQKVVYFQIVLLGYLASSVAYHFPAVLQTLDLLALTTIQQKLSISALLSVTFAGILAVLVGDAISIYLLTEHPRSKIEQLP
ncbi:MAG: hypothetical protein AUJ07_01240 [Crenarchaeota archaeon 13_1_40CM_3_53_5]|nr:MAG: hypothetical protein AUJ07_01240 [Crenarchaeota archaeon 13_1_40CM_3_53_5]